MDDQVKPPALPRVVTVTAAWQAEQAAKNRAYAAQRRRRAAKLEADELGQLDTDQAAAPAMPATPAPKSTAPKKQRRSPVRRKDRKHGPTPDPLQSRFDFYDE